MGENVRLKEVRNEIEQKRKELNEIIVEGIDKEKIVTFSQELDVLINKYYFLKVEE
ncbi:aspartyl-phosphate phosphatase Spo0E family protein [Tissierella pigra]|uniref:Aspartyl-phosphate phosphatase Spo0E family protein n=1 Tax=Tissierella pigra TaxID=2607614 RepID=A0A6N7XYY8_9FIRM|nr:aspartyl-phosphate phosphatase Spo0E family protein [Tissierella pigra]MBU5425804.1 aspartyl-phosphate phosphatase Spo0E family protein [Tissierella pigra]MSU01458.1 aspartyl-phosphate phosphatase Spo0E family protein [Tissierella pigra]